MRRSRASLVLAAAILSIAAAGILTAAGCSRPPQPVSVSREALGTVVSVTVYGGGAEEDRRSAANEAFAAMDAVERELDAHDASSAITAFNTSPYVRWTPPVRVASILDRVAALEVTSTFSPALWGVMKLYDFGGKGSVPETDVLANAVEAAGSLRRAENGEIGFPMSRRTLGSLGNPHRGPGTSDLDRPGRPGLDLGGALKGLALDEAVAALRASGTEAALITCGSSTVTFGRKAEGEPWRIGIEDPRSPGTVIATVSGDDTMTVSTSGDYQQYFERDGVRYHHILDPATGRPARGLRSLTVVGARNSLSSDILSTALFVMGPERAEQYARTRGLGLYMIDAEGDVRIVQPAGGSPVISPSAGPA